MEKIIKTTKETIREKVRKSIKKLGNENRDKIITLILIVVFMLMIIGVGSFFPQDPHSGNIPINLATER